MYSVISGGETESESGSDVAVRVNSSSGEVRAARRFDRESAAVVSVRLLAEDSGRPSRSACATLNIHVEDSDDHHPMFTQPTYVYDTIRYDTRCYFNVRSKANMSQLNLPHGTDN